MRELKEAIKETEESNEQKESELIQYRAQFELNEQELAAYREELTRLETERESLIEEINTIRSQQTQLIHDTSNELEANEYTKPQLTKSNSIKLAPRLFCDICDEFDLHDTDDCPQQYSSLAESKIEDEAHTKYNAVTSSANRDYCDLCESFGHKESECQMQSHAEARNKAVSDEEF